jgi:hypothetical protein
VGEGRRQDASRRAALEPDQRPQDDGGERQHEVPGSQRGECVRRGGDHDRVTRDGGVEGPAEEQLLGDSVDGRHQHQYQRGSLVGVVEHVPDLVVERRNLAHHETTDDEQGSQQHAVDQGGEQRP